MKVKEQNFYSWVKYLQPIGRMLTHGTEDRTNNFASTIYMTIKQLRDTLIK